MPPRYPDVMVKLVGEDSNAFNILGRINQALKEAGVSGEEREEFQRRCMSGDYDHLLRTAIEWVARVWFGLAPTGKRRLLKARANNRLMHCSADEMEEFGKRLPASARTIESCTVAGATPAFL